MGRVSKSKSLKFGKCKRKKVFNTFLSKTNADTGNVISAAESASETYAKITDMDCENNEFQISDKENECLAIEKESPKESGFEMKGRRIVDIAHFFQCIQNFKHCNYFSCTIKNVQIIGEKRKGLQSVIYFECNMCLNKCSVETTKNTNSISDVNYGIVLGITSSGGGYSHMEELTAVLDIPCMSSRTYNKIRKVVGDSWIKTAQASMLDAIEEEKIVAIKNNNVDEDGTPLLTVVADGCWSKRSYRSNYSALSGAAAIIGFHTKKIIFLSVKNKYCLICEVDKNKGKVVREHNCTMNYTGPSTGMEAASIVEGFKCSENLYGVRYNKLIADGDSAVYKKILDSRPYAKTHIQKIECRNHLFRNFRNKLRNIANMRQYSVRYRKFVLSNSSRIEIGVKKAIAHWKSMDTNTMNENILELAKDIRNAPYHVFGNHLNCADYFCSKNNDQHLYAINELENDGIFNELLTICRALSVHSNSLIADVDSNIVEQFHSIVAKFVGGKRVNLSFSDSYTHRCNAALVQHNSKKAFVDLSKTVFSKSPSTQVKKLLEKRKKHNEKSMTQRKQKSFLRKLSEIQDENYGTDTCQKPDLDEEIQNSIKKDIIEVLKTNQKNRLEIEMCTRDQANSHVWLEKRRNLLTASVFGKVCKRRVKKFGNLVKEILYSNISFVRSIKYGKINEEIAIEQLSRQLNIEIKKCGLFIHPEYEFLGATPDGLISNDGIVEVKCPFSAAGMDIDEAIRNKKINCWKIDKNTNEIIFDKNHNYYYQVQGQLNITGRDYCIFGVWTCKDKDLKIEKIYRDSSFLTQYIEKLSDFYFNCLLPEIVDPRYTRKMPIREPVAK